jgi:helicase
VISATPTLAAGINIPAYRVILRDLKRYMGFGMDYIPVLEAQQMLGRAGRPKFDTSGEAIMIAKDKGEAEFIWEKYVLGEPERIQSKLGVETVLRTHVLALIASGNLKRQDLLDFFAKTFYAHQYEESLDGKIDKVVDLLKEFNFVVGSKTSNDNPFRSAADLASDDSLLEATPMGKRVSELYLDPVTANYLITNMEKTERLPALGLLQLISNTIEMRPGLAVRKADDEKINELLTDEHSLIERPPNAWEIEFDDYVRSLKTAWFFSEWMEELGEDLIFEKFNVTPGELRVRLSNADWLLYSTQELAYLLVKKEALKDIRRVRLRVKYGIREELLPLVRLRGIGRVRARMLYSSSVRSLADLRKVPTESLSRIIGPALARSVKEQLNQAGEKSLGDY